MKILITFLFFSTITHGKVLLKDVGVIGLASHDMFTWDKKLELNLENGRLDLTTIFDFEDGKRWMKGGNPKNSENAPVYTVTMALVKHYQGLLRAGHTKDDARGITVKLFHGMVRESYERMVGRKFPEVGLEEGVTNVEQAVMRGMHDILPGKVKLFDRRGRTEMDLTNYLFAKTMLNDKEMNQPIAYFNGDYDEEYKDINIPFSIKNVNLMEVDREFIEKFSPYNQIEMLEDLGRVGKGEILISDVGWMNRLDELFSKAICPIGYRWMPEIPCIMK